MVTILDQQISPLPTAPLAAQTAAAKLHVLHLSPIKAKLDDKWTKLSELVHKLFETAIRNAQGPRDHFTRIDELSYVVTFHGLAFEEASLACASIATEVCEKLFGGTETDISVRALVGQLSNDILASHFEDGSHISELLELNGKEIVVRNNPTGSPRSTTKVVAGADDVDWEPVNTIRKASASLLPLGLQIGLFPVWDLDRNTSSCVYASAFFLDLRKIGCARRLLSGRSEQVPQAEISLLYAAHAFGHRVRNARKVCVVGASVSYETLTCFNARIRYITALKSLTVSAECPMLLKLEEIPPGTPLGKLAELIGMLSIPNLRFVLQFKSHLAVPDEINIRLGASGIGFGLPPQCDTALAGALMKKLTRAFAAQKGFVFLEGLDSPALVAIARENGVRFGTGQALGQKWLSGTDEIPAFPLPID